MASKIAKPSFFLKWCIERNKRNAEDVSENAYTNKLRIQIQYYRRWENFVRDKNKNNMLAIRYDAMQCMFTEHSTRRQNKQTKKVSSDKYAVMYAYSDILAPFTIPQSLSQDKCYGTQTLTHRWRIRHKAQGMNINMYDVWVKTHSSHRSMHAYTHRIKAL